MIIRPLAPSDLDLVCSHRDRMFRDMGRDEALRAAMAAPFRSWLEPRLGDGRYFGLVAEEDGRSIGGVGLMELDWPPHPMHPEDGRRGYVLNVFVEPDCRGRGVARAMMAAAEAEFKARGLTYATLHAAPAGRPLYESEGWAATAEMAKALRA